MSGLNSFLCVHRHGKSGADSVLSCVQLTEHGSHGCCTAVGHPRTGVWQNRMLLSFSCLFVRAAQSDSLLLSRFLSLFLTRRGGRPLVFALFIFCSCWTMSLVLDTDDFFMVFQCKLLFLCVAIWHLNCCGTEICHRFWTSCASICSLEIIHAFRDWRFAQFGWLRPRRCVNFISRCESVSWNDSAVAIHQCKTFFSWWH